MAKKKEVEENLEDSALDKFLGDIEKRFGKGAVMNLEEGISGIEWVSSGSLTLDNALGGGYPKGRIIEIFGENGTSKTTLTIHAMVECQKEGGLVGFIDYENAFDLKYAKNLGLNISKNKFQLSQPSNAEEGLEIIEAMVKTGIFSMIIVDSVAAMSPRAELEGDMGESKMGLHARLMSQAMRKLVGVINKAKTVVIFINQTRTSLGVMFGDPTVTTGGNALKFYSSQRIQTFRSGQTKDKEENVIAIGCKCKVIKNKVAPPFKTALFSVEFGKGIDKLGEIIDLAVEYDIIQKKGAGWMSYEEAKLGQGVDAVKQTLQDNPDLLDEITNKVKQQISEK